jgi:hypothetical protein
MQPDVLPKAIAVAIHINVKADDFIPAEPSDLAK